MSLLSRLFGLEPPTVQSVVGVPEYDANGHLLPLQAGWFQQAPGEASRIIRTTPPPLEDAHLWYQDDNIYAPIESKPNLSDTNEVFTDFGSWYD